VNLKDHLDESSLNRIHQHIQKKKINSWAIMTSYRSENSPTENKKDFNELKQRLRSMDLGFIEIEGIGQEESEDGGIKQVKEPSLFIPKITKKKAQKLSDRYDQWGYIYSGPETDDKIALISVEGTEYLGDFHPNKISQFFSKIKGKPFTFETVKPTTYMESYWKYLKSNKSQ